MTGGETPDGSKVQGQFEDLLSLVLARSRGEVGNDDVEKALSSIVAGQVPSTSGKDDADTSHSDGTIQSTRRSQRKRKIIIPDNENYDDDSEDDDAQEEAATKKSSLKHHATKKAPDEVAATERAIRKKKNDPERLQSLEEIPLGKMGEKMLVTFGDGPVPDLDVISVALLGTRKFLQRVILDARALRRRMKDDWHQARAAAMMPTDMKGANEQLKKTSTGIQKTVVDNELSFQAMDASRGNLRYDVPCGFEVRQLETLFPEEIGPYKAWKKMHDAYNDKSGEVTNKPETYDGSASKNEDEEDEEDEAAAVGEEKRNGGRLNERLSNFDARTNVMGEDWYMKFAEVRRGSFLPRHTRGKESVAANEVSEKTAKKRGRPRQSRTSWVNLNPTSIIFLHWIGFDPRSALSPPNEETTQALGFLAYDFFGKIVEKAVSLRLDSDGSKHAKRKLSRSEGPLLELTKGDQLERGNIEQALEEMDLNSLYCSSNIELGKSANIAQLYFGPGFEDRLELEMDEIFGSKQKSLSPEELEARQKEEHLFSELPEVPTLLSGVSSVIDGDQTLDGRTALTSSKKRRRRSSE
eukprot:CAMPEP_0183719102 /NCGR_PEP_ID=MMETSP0737-20130205/12178_1 /TAXON_ID=385413 /ORGANISM="Thalassiosira miniscula, Strain CCMP1093" /LENGTH=580 /DNA_ID=CAMNT_0025948803 /DNA_START=27 /DNA_END=1769 /DNA_ORIENTATION=-